jgi:iron complex outermembrane receptor protein
LGIEVDGSIKLSEKLAWDANLTLSRNKIEEFSEILYDYGVDFDEFNVITRTFRNTDISFSPNIIAGSVFRYMPSKAAEISLLTKYVGRQFMDNTSNSSRQLDAYLTNDVRVSYAFTPKFMKELRLNLLVNNVFDVAYESNGYTWGYLGGGEEFRENYYYPQAGRHFMVMLSARF